MASLLLPPIQENILLAQLSTHTGPFHAHCPSNKPFTTSPDSRIHVVSVEYMPKESGISFRPRYCFFIHNRFLLSYTMHNKVPRGTAVPWAEWGSSNTRFLVHYVPFQWLRFIVTLINMRATLMPRPLPDTFTDRESSVHHYITMEAI